MLKRHPIFTRYIDGETGPLFGCMALLCTICHAYGTYNLLDTRSRLSDDPGGAIEILCFFLVLFLALANKAEQRLFLPTKMVVAGLIAQKFRLLLLVFYGLLWWNPEIYRFIFPSTFGVYIQIYSIVIPASVYGITGIILWAVFLKSNLKDKESGYQETDQPNITKEQAV